MAVGGLAQQDQRYADSPKEIRQRLVHVLQIRTCGSAGVGLDGLVPGELQITSFDNSS